MEPVLGPPVRTTLQTRRVRVRPLSLAGKFRVFVSLALLSAAPCFGAASQGVPPAPAAMMRKVVLEKAGAGYRWKLVTAPLPAPGEHQVLVRVHAVGLNRGELTLLEPDAHADHSGQVPASAASADRADIPARGV